MRRIKHRKLAIGMISAGMLIGSIALAEDAWIKTEVIQIRSGKGAIYPVLVEAHKGDKLDVIAHEGKWLKVKVGDKEGYVYEDNISSDKVGSGGNVLANLGAGGGNVSSADAGKGLNPDTEAYAAGKHIDPKVLDKIIADNKKIDPKDFEAFENDGKVGSGK